MEKPEKRSVRIDKTGAYEHKQAPPTILKGTYTLLSTIGWNTTTLTARELLEIAAYVEQQRAKLEHEASQPIEALPDDRYYALQVSTGFYQVRERQYERHMRPDDPVVQIFGENMRKACRSAGQWSHEQRHLDEQYGHWKRHAVVGRIATQGPSYGLAIYHNIEERDDGHSNPFACFDIGEHDETLDFNPFVNIS